MKSAHVLWLLAAGMTAACGDPMAPGPGEVFFQTDSASYKLAQTGVGYDVTIGLTFTNRTSKTVSFVNCNGITGVALQQLTNGSWKGVWSPVEDACLSGPISVAPNQAHHWNIHVYAAPRGSNITPQFDTDAIAGTYRVIFYDAVTNYNSNGPPFGDQLPEAGRVSNPFTISIE